MMIDKQFCQFSYGLEKALILALVCYAFVRNKKREVEDHQLVETSFQMTQSDSL